MRISRDGLTDSYMRRYIIPLLRGRQSDNCAYCGGELFDYQINHKRYAEDITLDDLELLHRLCHVEITGGGTGRGKAGRSLWLTRAEHGAG